MKKLEQLYEYEETLLSIDKSKKENRRGLQTICRMQGSITQSYFLLDATQHQEVRKIFYELEAKEEEQVETNQSELDEVFESMT